MDIRSLCCIRADGRLNLAVNEEDYYKRGSMEDLSFCASPFLFPLRIESVEFDGVVPEELAQFLG